MENKEFNLKNVRGLRRASNFLMSSITLMILSYFLFHPSFFKILLIAIFMFFVQFYVDQGGFIDGYEYCEGLSKEDKEKIKNKKINF